MQATPIAIIGMGCRFPGGENPEAFWRLLSEGGDSIVLVPQDRWDAEEFYDPDLTATRKMNAREGGFLNDVYGFDSQFFKIAPREAAQIDPQQRLLLQVSWEALEDAGQTLESLAGTPTGVFIGIATSDYALLQFDCLSDIDTYASTGSAVGLAANRLSYVFDVRGPSVAVDTACSSSLVAVHLACQSLWSGESTLALAGGVNLILSPWPMVSFAKLGVLSPDARCKAFDARANGYVRGEGAGIIVLKPLSKAVADKDRIYAVIRGSATNQDGRSNGITAPNRFAQEAVLSEAYRRAGISPGLVQYVEAHGAGTQLGDPIEAQALGAILSIDRPAERYCALGSVKTNIGHLEAAAGIAGLIKVALSLKHRLIPPSLHFLEPNPHIPFDELPLRVQQSCGPWRDWGGPIVAGVSSFGFGGSNAHVVLTEAIPEPAEPDGGASDRLRLLPLSAHTPIALEALARAYHQMLTAEESASAVELEDLCYWASVRRSHHEYRLALRHSSRGELVDRLEAFLKGLGDPNILIGRRIPSRRPKVAFVFSGQGPRWVGVGRELFEGEPAFQAVVRQCDQILSDLGEISLVSEYTGEAIDSRLDDPGIAQPAFVAFQVAIAELLQHWGIRPTAVIGHSLGEVAAAHLAGALSLADAMRVAFHRGRLMRRRECQGSMLSVELGEEEARRLIAPYEDRLSIAAINSPNSTVISGDAEAVEDALQGLNQRGVYFRHLPLGYASHSSRMRSVEGELTREIGALDLKPASVPMYSTVTGELIDGSSLDAGYWARQIQKPVRFSAAAKNLIRQGVNIVIEVAPRPVLAVAIDECFSREGKQGIVLQSLSKGEGERAALLRSLGALYTTGVPVNWESLSRSSGRNVRMPLYPWQPERYPPNEPDQSGTARPLRSRTRTQEHPLLGRCFHVAGRPQTYVWEFDIEKRSVPYLYDRRVRGQAVFAGAAFIEMVLAAMAQLVGDCPCVLKTVEFQRPLFLSENAARKIQLVISLDGSKSGSFQIYSERSVPREWDVNVIGELLLGDGLPYREGRWLLESDSITRDCLGELSGTEFYRGLANCGLQYGPAFQGIQHIWRRDAAALARLRIPQPLNSEINRYRLHPAVLDAGLQTLAATTLSGAAGGATDECFLLKRVGEVRTYGSLSPDSWSYAQLDETPSDSVRGNVYLLNEDRRLAAEFLGVQCQRESAVGCAGLGVEDWLYQLCWQPAIVDTLSPATPGPSSLTGESWVIFADERGLGERLAKLTVMRGANCFLVSRGLDYAIVDDSHFTANPKALDDSKRILQVVSERYRGSAVRVVYLWGLDDVSDEVTIESLRIGQEIGCYGVLRLVQALIRSDLQESPRLWLVTRGTQVVTDKEICVNITQSPLWGFGRAVEREHSELWGGLIDLDPEAPGSEAALQTEALVLLQTILEGKNENEIAIRGAESYVARLSRERELKQREHKFQWRADASYLITGGLGDLGLEVARWMVKQGARRIILLGRTELGPRSEWRNAEAGTRQAGLISAIRELDALGVTIHTASVDVANEQELSRFLEQFEREGWPSIRGVIHAAGVLADRTLSLLDHETLEVNLRPKVYGAWLLQKLLDHLCLDFFVLFSSAASLIGSPGQAAFSAANAFLDTLAHYLRKKGKPALSINWGPWRDIGLAARDSRGRRLAAYGFGTIQPSDGLEALGLLLSQTSSQVAVMPVDWNSAARLDERRSGPSLLAHLAEECEDTDAVKASAGSSLSRLLVGATKQRRLQLIEDYLRQELATVLGWRSSRMDANQSLRDLGIDSLMAVMLKNRIAVGMGVAAPIIKLLHGPTIVELAAYLSDEMEQKTSDCSGRASKAENTLAESSRNGSSGPRAFVAPRTKTEELLAAICAETFELPQVGVYDDVLDGCASIGDSGGGRDRSLSAWRLISRVREVFQVALTLQNLSDARTVDGLSLMITKRLALLVGREHLLRMLEDVERLTENEAALTLGQI
jgi:acyl transferase domain-containing protein/acyl carrier protein